jgi:hypothetical protein
LNATFSANKIGKQVLLASIGFSGTEPTVKHLLGTFQKKFEVLPSVPVDASVFVEAMDVSQIDIQAPDLIAFDKMCGPFESERAFVSAYLKVHQEKDVKNAFLKKFPQLNESIIKVVVL